MGIVQGPGVGINKTEKFPAFMELTCAYMSVGVNAMNGKGGVLNVFGPVMTKVGKVIGM